MSTAEFESDKFVNLRTTIEKSVRRIKKYAPSFDIDKVPLTDRKVMRTMVSSAFGRKNTWSPFAHKHTRKILRLLAIETPAFEDLMHLPSLGLGEVIPEMGAALSSRCGPAP